MFFSKGKKIYGLINLHLDAVKSCQETLCDFMNEVLNNGITKRAETLGEEIEDLESVADRNRHEIIMTLLNGALLPDLRREVLKLIEYIDEVANEAEEISNEILLQRIAFPTEIIDYIVEINKKETKLLETLSQAVNRLFNNFKDFQNDFEILKTIELLESEVDDLENDTIKTLYEMDLSLAEKNQLRIIISKIADISDIIEDTSDIMEIILAIRKV